MLFWNASSTDAVSLSWESLQRVKCAIKCSIEKFDKFERLLDLWCSFAKMDKLYFHFKQQAEYLSKHQKPIIKVKIINNNKNFNSFQTLLCSEMQVTQVQQVKIERKYWFKSRTEVWEIYWMCKGPPLPQNMTNNHRKKLSYQLN